MGQYVGEGGRRSIMATTMTVSSCLRGRSTFCHRGRGARVCTDRITVLTEVITYIQSLWGTLQELEQKKVEMMDLLGVTGRLVKDEDSDGHHVVGVGYINNERERDLQFVFEGYSGK